MRIIINDDFIDKKWNYAIISHFFFTKRNQFNVEIIEYKNRKKLFFFS